jgi:hypothetical protein
MTQIAKHKSPPNSRGALRVKIINREAKKPGLKGKIRAFCCECIYDPYQDGSWLKQVENCTSTSCPLYTVRPLPASPAKSPEPGVGGQI